MTNSPQFFATTAKGMEELLAQELQALGGQDVKVTRAGVSFQGGLEVAYRACLESRIANRVLLPLKTFDAPNPEKLYGGVKSIRWSDHIEPTQTLAVDFSSSHSQITHTQFGALKVKDAIVDQFRSVFGVRPSIDTARPDLRVNVYLNNDQATVSIDLSGESLHRRGYRTEDAGAPLKENLAAAILMHANWPEIARKGGALVDPMCGSGTIPIEAALMASRIAPGIDRRYFGFLKWKKHDAPLWKKVVQRASDAEVSDEDALKVVPTIVGYDHDFRAVRTAIDNVERADMRSRVHIEKREFAVLEPLKTWSQASDGPKGIVVVNPPYGERLGEVEDLKALYKQMGDIFKQRFKGWEAYIFTGNLELAKFVGLQAARRIVLYNGSIECRLLKYELY